MIMKAVIIDNFGGVDQLHLKTDIPTPTPGDTECLIQVNYAGVNPVDYKIRQGAFRDSYPYKFPLILGWDCSGVVRAVGKNVKNFKPGDEVFAYCRKPQIQWGTYAEYITFDAANVSLKPSKLSFAEAAAIPLAALTAWQTIIDFAGVKAGQWVLIHAGAGGVGGFAIQFAHNAGAKVITTASEANHAYVKSLGADYTIDYHKNNVAQKVREICPQGVDVVLDTVGHDTLKESIGMLKPTGCLVSIVERNFQAFKLPATLKSGFVFVQPDGRELSQIAKMIQEGKVQAPKIHEFSLKEVAKAHEQSQSHHTCGKNVLKVRD